MSQMGIGAALHYLGGGSPENPTSYYGRTITAAKVWKNQELRLTFDDGVIVRLYDAGQSCCESRYMVVDDDLNVLIGHKLVAIETNSAKIESFDPASDKTSDYHDVLEATFLDIKSDGGMVTISFRVDHNGYYGGFGLSLAEV